MNEVNFMVQGSAEEPYQVTFVKRTDRNISAYCTCPAGSNGQYCKHRFNILAGIVDGIVSGNESDVKIVQEMLHGTDLEGALVRLRNLEVEADKIKVALSTAKKDVAKAMRD